MLRPVARVPTREPGVPCAYRPDPDRLALAFAPTARVSTVASSSLSPTRPPGQTVRHPGEQARQLSLERRVEYAPRAAAATAMLARPQARRPRTTRRTACRGAVSNRGTPGNDVAGNRPHRRARSGPPQAWAAGWCRPCRLRPVVSRRRIFRRCRRRTDGGAGGCAYTDTGTSGSAATSRTCAMRPTMKAS